MIKYFKRGDYVAKLFVIINIFIVSIIVNTLAPLMPLLQKELNISISKSSSIPVFAVLGTTIFSIILSFLISRIGIKKSNYFGYLFLFVGLLMFSLSKSLIGIILASFFIGASSSFLFTSLTTLLAHLENPHYGITHAFFGIGGIVAPLLVSFSIKYNFSYRFLYFSYFLLTVFIFIWNVFIKMPDAKYEVMNFSKIKSTILKPIFFLSIISFLLYSGSEIGLITWVSNLFIYFGSSPDVAALSISSFWIFYTISRFLSDFVVKFISEKKIVIFCTLFSSMFIFIMLITKNSLIFLIIGFLMGAVFPMIQRYANMKLNKDEVGLLNGITFASTGVGGMIFSYFMGLLSKVSIPLMFIFPILGLLFVAFIQFIEKRGVKS
ncbi:MAG: hypothetical protein PWP54_1466 [Thermosipho sp. (in: thermotogales)]|nr:hypothetical protein [Thermosipho sp. (in: thermotogales)]